MPRARSVRLNHCTKFARAPRSPVLILVVWADPKLADLDHPLTVNLLQVAGVVAKATRLGRAHRYLRV